MKKYLNRYQFIKTSLLCMHDFLRVDFLTEHVHDAFRGFGRDTFRINIVSKTFYKMLILE